MEEKLCFFDLETAGLKDESQIIQIAAIAVDALITVATEEHPHD